MKKIALFGATGKTGTEFLKLALQKGYELKVLLRSPEKLSVQSDKLHVLVGDVLNEQDVNKTVEGCDLVVSLFGHVKGSPEFLQRDGTKYILRAMETWGLKKIISLSGGGLPFPQKDEPKFMDKLIRGIMKLFVPKILNDAIAHHKVLAESKAEWIIVRAPRLTQEAKKGIYRVGWVGVNASTKIGRADLADFILKQIEDEQFLYQMPFVSY